jgi:hypothetical protein
MVLSALETTVVDCAASLAVSPFGQRSKALWKGARQRAGKGAMFTLPNLLLSAQGPPIQREMNVMTMMRMHNEPIDDPADREFVVWVASIAAEIAAELRPVWDGIPVLLVEALVDEDDVLPTGSLYSPGIRSRRSQVNVPEVSLFTGKTGQKVVRQPANALHARHAWTAISSIGTAHLTEFQSLRAHLDAERQALLQRTTTIEEGAESVRVLVRELYLTRASKNACDTSLALRHYNLLVNHTLAATLSLALRTVVLTPGDSTSITQRQDGWFDIEVLERGDPLTLHPLDAVRVSTEPEAGIYVIEGTKMNFVAQPQPGQAGMTVTLHAQRLASLEAV